MAIVKTTTTETNTTGPGTAPPVLDKTRSVVNQGGSPAVRPARAVGARPSVNRTPAAGAPAKPRAFIDDTIAELRRVVWPTKEDVRAGTIVTVGLLFFFGLYIYGLNNLMENLLRVIGVYPK